MTASGPSTLKALPHLRRALLALAVLLALTAGAALARPAAAQSGSPYGLTLSRNFGFGSGSDIRGDMSLKITAADSAIQSVVFRIDGQAVAAVSAEPFTYRFNTNDYPSGVRSIDALITLQDGSQTATAARQYNFLSADAESAAMRKILIPLGGILAVVILINVVSQGLMGKKRLGSAEPGAQRSYGFAGGSICRHCSRPTPRHMWGVNLLIGKLDRCENCGKWSMMRAYPLDVLRAAEAAEAIANRPHMPQEKSEEEKLRELLDKSKYEDMP